MKKMLKSFGIAAVAAVIGFGFASCEGPAGLQGTPGGPGRAADRLVFEEPTEYFYRGSFAGYSFNLTGFFGGNITYTEFRYDAPITGVYGNLAVVVASGDNDFLEVDTASITIDRNGLISGDVVLIPGSDFPPTGTAAAPVTVTVSAAGLTANLSVVLMPTNYSVTPGTPVVRRGGEVTTQGVTVYGGDVEIIVGGAAAAGNIGPNLDGVTITIPFSAVSLGIDNRRFSNNTLSFVQLVDVDIPNIGTSAAPIDAFTISGTLVLGPGGSTPATENPSALVLAFANGIEGPLDDGDPIELEIVIGGTTLRIDIVVDDV